MGLIRKLFGGKAKADVTSDDIIAPLTEVAAGAKSGSLAGDVRKSAKKVVPLDLEEAIEENSLAAPQVAARQVAAPQVAAPQVDVADAVPKPEIDLGEAEAVMEAVAEAVSGDSSDVAADSDDAEASVNIWDLDDDTPSADAVEATSASAAPVVSPPVAAEAAAAPARRRRNKTRLLGFDKSDGQVVDFFNAGSAPAGTATNDIKFPIGWVVIVEGPGLGAFFTLQSGMAQIGRGEDQAVQLDFGDNAISRTNHAAIVYDPESNQVLLGHGGKSNLVRLNGSPLISNETLKDGDRIRLGETTLRFSAFCDDQFNWNQAGTEENDDVEIA